MGLNFTGEKPAWLSVTVWSGLSAIVLGMYGAVSGSPIPEGLEPAQVAELLDQASSAVWGLLISLSGIVTIWGRFRASSKVTMKKTG